MNDIKRFESHKSLNITLLKYERRRFLCFLFVLIFGFISNSILAQTISTDKLDYAPGETVRITGVGWTNDDVITLHIINETNPDLNSTEHYRSWEVKPINGNFTSTWDVTQEELSTSLVLTAEGKVSGFKYQVSFTDDSNLIVSGKVQLANGTGISGATITGYTSAAHTTIDATTTSDQNGFWTLSLDKGTTRYVVVTPPVCYSSSDVILGTNPGSIAEVSISEIQLSSPKSGGTSANNRFILILNQNTITAPSFTTFCATSSGSDITIVGSDLGPGATYQWQINTNANDLDNTWSYSNISGATSKDYNPGTITTTTGYRRVSSTCSSSSNIVKMFVTPGISGNTITSSTPTNNCGSFYANYINGSYPSGGNNNNFTFQWQSSTDGVNYTNITGETGQHYNFPGGNATSTIYFRRIVYSGYCTSYSNVLFYNTQFATISGALTVNAGSTTQLSGSPSGGTWSSATPSVATVNSSTGLVLGVSAGTSIITYTTTAGCSGTATVTVNSASTTPTVTIFSPASACSGSGASVVITGTNFTGATAVNFNGLSATSYSINSSIQITATLPAGATTGPISVTTSSGTGTSSSNFTVNPLPTAVTVSGGGTYCGSATITASGGTGGTIYYQGTTSGGTSTATASSSQSVTTSGTYYFRSQSADGCWGPEGSAIVTINILPTPNFTAAPADPECQDDNVTYTTLSGMTNYIWGVPGTSADYSITSGGIGTGSNTVTLKWLTTGSKTVTVGYTGVNGCASASPASSTITVNPTPVIGTFN